MKEKIGVAFLGVGRMGETHLRNLLGLSGVKVVVVADSRLEAAERGKALAGAEQALTDVEQAITHPGVDAVVIVTPTDTHARLLELAAYAGKAVFSEKPIALNLAETTRVVNVIRERGIPVQLGFMRRFDPGYARAKQKIEAGDLGRIELFRALSRDTIRRALNFCLEAADSFWTWRCTIWISPVSWLAKLRRSRHGARFWWTKDLPRRTMLIRR